MIATTCNQKLYKPDWFFLPFFISSQVFLKHTLFSFCEKVWIIEWCEEEKSKKIKVFYVVMNLSGSLFVILLSDRITSRVCWQIKVFERRFLGIWIASHRKRGSRTGNSPRRHKLSEIFQIPKKLVHVNTLLKFQIGLLTNLGRYTRLSTCLFDYVKQAEIIKHRK